MHLKADLECVASVPKSEDLSQFVRDIAPEWIEEALAATGTATLRRRRLPMEQVPWLVIGMALLRGRPITDVVDSLDLAMPSPTKPTVARSAVTQARDRLGESPMAWLFAHSADHWAHQSAARARWRGLALYGVDGTTLRVQDTEENREHFGLADSGNRGTSGYPLVRLVGLMALRSHLLAAASFGPYRHGEHWYAADLWPCLPDDSVVIVDRNFWAANVLIPVQRDGTNRHWLIRAKANTSGRCIRRLGAGETSVSLSQLVDHFWRDMHPVSGTPENGSLAVALPAIPTGEAISVLSYTNLPPTTGTASRGIGFVTRTAASARSASVDFSGDSLPLVTSAALELPAEAAPTISWAFEGSTANLDAVVAYVLAFRNGRMVEWYIVTPPDRSAPLTIPTFPGSLAELMPAAGDDVSLTILSMAVDEISGPAEFRADGAFWSRLIWDGAEEEEAPSFHGRMTYGDWLPE